MGILIKSIASGIVTAIILLIAKYAGPKLAGAIGGVPIVFAVSYVLLTMNNRGMAKDYLIGGIFGALAGVFFSLILIWLNAQFIKAYWLNFVIAYALCLLLAVVLVHFNPKV